MTTRAANTHAAVLVEYVKLLQQPEGVCACVCIHVCFFSFCLADEVCRSMPSPVHHFCFCLFFVVEAKQKNLHICLRSFFANSSSICAFRLTHTCPSTCLHLRPVVKIEDCVVCCCFSYKTTCQRLFNESVSWLPAAPAPIYERDGCTG